VGEPLYLSLVPVEWIQKYKIRSISKIGHSIQIQVEKFLPQAVKDELTTIFGEDIIINQETINVSHPIESWQKLLDTSIQRGASDIHLDPKKQSIATRIRLDGMLIKTEDYDWVTYDYLLRIFKIRGKLKITEKRCPQEGGFPYTYRNNQYDIRVSTIPTIFGEKLSIRILPQEQSLLSLQDLGMSEPQIQMIHSALAVRNGSVVVNGPTGSGKSTTLHVLLNQFNKQGYQPSSGQ
jgi:type IV pilus assembly protein PilB